jgi:hypothetical protein
MGKDAEARHYQIFRAMINYHNKTFRPVSNTDNGETSADTLFLYQQKNNILTSAYAGGRIIAGQLIGMVDEQGNIDMRYHQVNDRSELMTGACKSTPEVLPNGKVRLHEHWRWTSGDCSEGYSVLEEV